MCAREKDSTMHRALLWLGRLSGLGGVLLVTVAVAIRLTGSFWLGPFQLGTLILGGIAGMVLGCLCLLAVLVERADRS
jgi:hypothetical protein